MRLLDFPNFASAMALAVIVTGMSSAQAQVTRFHFSIDPNVPLKDLLPAPPNVKASPRPVVTEDLAQVPEVFFLETGSATIPFHETIARQIAGINFLNQKRTDHFMEVLLENRPDLAGLPFVLGAACRLGKPEQEKFTAAV